MLIFEKRRLALICYAKKQEGKGKLREFGALLRADYTEGVLGAALS
jgi:hypothetical protein